MAYEQTAVPVSRSQEAIRKLILQNGGTGIAFFSRPPIEGFEAYVLIDGTSYCIRLQAECKPDSRVHTRRGCPVDPFEQDCKRIWRVLYNQMKSIYESSRTGVMELRRLVLAFIVTKDGRTVGDHILPQLRLAVEGRIDRMLPAYAEAIDTKGMIDAEAEAE
jgi:hypothetical protein